MLNASDALYHFTAAFLLYENHMTEQEFDRQSIGNSLFTARLQDGRRVFYARYRGPGGTRKK